MLAQHWSNKGEHLVFAEIVLIIQLICVAAGQGRATCRDESSANLQFTFPQG